MRKFWVSVALVLLVGQSSAYLIWRSVGPRTASPLALAATESRPTAVLCAVAAGSRVTLLRSTDNGVTWPVVVESLGFRPWAIAFAPGDRQVVFAAAGRIWKSTDQGGSWRPLTTPDGRFYFGLGTNRRHPGDVWVAGHFATTSGGQAVVARSTDLGESWTEFVCDSLLRTGAQSVAPDPTDDSIIYCAGALAGRAVVWKSTDRGGSWIRTLLPVPPRDGGGVEQPPPQEEPLKGAVNTLYVNPLGTSVVTAAVEWSGLYRSTDRGVSWVRSADIGEAHSLAFGANQANFGLVGRTNSVMLTSDGGISWGEAWDPPAGGPVRCLAVATDSAAAWCATPSSIYRSTNGGLKWYAAKVLAAGEISAVHVSRQQYGNVFAAVVGDNLHCSTDFGVVWAACARFPGSDSVVSVATGPASEVWALADAGLYRSTNLGQSWTLKADWFDRAGAVAFSSGVPRIGVVTGSRYDSAHVLRFVVARTADGGLNWSSTMLSTPGVARTATVCVGDAGLFLVGGDSAADGVIFESRDTGLTWQRSDVGLPGRVSCVGALYNYRYHSYTRYCAGDSGVYSRWNTDPDWRRLGPELPGANALTNAEYSPMLVACDSGVFCYNGSEWESRSEGLLDLHAAVIDGGGFGPYVYVGTPAGLFQSEIEVAVEHQGPTPLELPGYRGAGIVRGVLLIRASGDGRTAIGELLDISGRAVMSLRPGPNDVRHLAPGIYFVREESQVDGYRSQVVRKVVIAR